MKLTSSSDISSIDYEKSPEKIHTSPMYRFLEILIGWGRKVRGGYRLRKSRQEGQNNFFNDHELLVVKLFRLFMFSGLFN